LDFYGIVNTVFWLGVFGGSLVIGSLIAILVQMEKNYVVPNNTQLPHIGFDEFYDASDNISFDMLKENVW
jgi:hypothetical protein